MPSRKPPGSYCLDPDRDGHISKPRWLGRRGLRITLCPTRALVALEKNNRDTEMIYGYGSIPIYRYIFSGMNIHLPAILMFTRATWFWHTAIYRWCESCWTKGYPIFELTARKIMSEAPTWIDNDFFSEVFQFFMEFKWWLFHCCGEFCRDPESRLMLAEDLAKEAIKADIPIKDNWQLAREGAAKKWGIKMYEGWWGKEDAVLDSMWLICVVMLWASGHQTVIV